MQYEAPQVISAVPTPFTESGEVDLDAFNDLLDRLDEYVDQVFVAGTTGEFPALGAEERIALFRAAARRLGPDRVIGHIGAPSLREVLHLLRKGRDEGLNTFAAISPCFFEVDDDVIVQHFRSIAAHLDGASLYAYLFPERTGSAISASALDEVLAIEGVVGVKLSGGANRHLDHLLARRGTARILSGDDGRFAEIVRAGGAGVVSGCSAAFPQAFAQLKRALTTYDADAVAAAQRAVAAAVALVGPSILRLKAELARQSGATWATRMAMVSGPRPA